MGKKFPSRSILREIERNIENSSYYLILSREIRLEVR